MNARPAVSVAVRSRDEASFVPRIFATLERQTLPPLEVVFMDHDSTDGTPELAERHPGVRAVRWGSEPWSYARHTNRAVAACRGEIVACLVGHAVPVGDDWLERLVAPLADPEVAGVYGRQVPHPGCSLLEVRRLEDSFGPEPSRQRDLPFFSTVHCALRRSVWERFPFDEGLPSGEDAVWAARVQQHGFAVCYEPAARVLHSHDPRPGVLLRRAYPEGRGLAPLYPRSAAYLLRKAVARWLKGTRRDYDVFRREGAAAWWYPFAFGFELAETLVLHAGVVRGWMEQRAALTSRAPAPAPRGRPPA